MMNNIITIKADLLELFLAFLQSTGKVIKLIAMMMNERPSSQQPEKIVKSSLYDIGIIYHKRYNGRYASMLGFAFLACLIIFEYNTDNSKFYFPISHSSFTSSLFMNATIGVQAIVNYRSPSGSLGWQFGKIPARAAIQPDLRVCRILIRFE